MNNHPLRFRFLQIAMLAALVAGVFIIGSTSATAQCGVPGCNTIQMDTYEVDSCCAPVLVECSNGSVTPLAGSPFCQDQMEEFQVACPCTNGATMVAIRVPRPGLGPVRIPVGTGTPVLVSPGCCLYYDVQVMANGCVRIKIVKDVEPCS